jgi:hypothetical protein
MIHPPYDFLYNVKYINTLFDSKKVLSDEALEQLINSNQPKIIVDAAEKILIERFFKQQE